MSSFRHFIPPKELDEHGNVKMQETNGVYKFTSSHTTRPISTTRFVPERQKHKVKVFDYVFKPFNHHQEFLDDYRQQVVRPELQYYHEQKIKQTTRPQQLVSQIPLVLDNRPEKEPARRIKIREKSAPAKKPSNPTISIKFLIIKQLPKLESKHNF